MSLTLVKAGHVLPVNMEALRDGMADYAKDIKLNLSSVMTPEGAPELTQAQIDAIALASAYATKHHDVVSAVYGEVAPRMDASMQQAAKAAATVMAMNNIYYRYVHLSNDEEIKKLPAKLRMSVIGSPGVAKIDFEMMCLAVSAINGCGMCIEAHNHELIKAGASKLALQSCARIAAVINAAAQAQTIG
jgi:alkyl hydroperoxide reductase subunit D